MDITVRITKPAPDADPTVSVSADGATVGEVFELVLAAAEIIIGREVAAQLEQHGATPAEVRYATPLRTRLLAIETLVAQPFRSFEMAVLDL